MCFLEKGYCKALCDFLFEQFIQNSFGPRPPCTKYNQEVIDLCQPAMQKRSEEHSSPKRCFFLPSFLCCLFLYKKGKKTIPLLSHPLLVIFEARPSLLVLHACINRLTTDFRRSRPPPPIIHSSFYLIFFPPLICSTTEQTNGLCSFCYYQCLLYNTLTQLMRGSIFTPLRMSIESAILTMMPQPSLSTRTSFMQLI